MGDSYVNLAGIPVMRLLLTVPFYGIWTADVTLAVADSIPMGAGAATLEIGAGFSLVGTVVRAASFSGARSARLVGGYGGWKKTLSAIGYGSPIGVLLSHVLGDAATDAGEKLALDADRSVGTHYVRAVAPATQVLHLLTGGAWWMGFDGVTRTAARDSSSITSPFQVVKYSGGLGRFEVATENPEDWTPGRTFTAPTVTAAQTIESVTHMVENDGKARLEVLATGADAPPLLRQLVRQEPIGQVFLGRWEYVVQSSSDAAADIAPASQSVPLPALTSVSMAPGLGCERVQLAAGSKCTLAFRNGDPSRPEIVAGDFDETPVTTRLGGASGAAPAARKGDDVLCAYTVVTGTGSLDSIYSGTAAGFVAAAARAVALGGGAVVNTITGSVSKGSDHVSIGGGAV